MRAYGFSERELKYTHDYLLADYASLYVERDQVYAQVRYLSPLASQSLMQGVILLMCLTQRRNHKRGDIG